MILPATKQIEQGLLRRVFRVNTIRFNVQLIIPRPNKIGPPIWNKYISAEYNVDEEDILEVKDNLKYYRAFISWTSICQQFGLLDILSRLDFNRGNTYEINSTVKVGDFESKEI